jgi:hypothetical protein
MNAFIFASSVNKHKGDATHAFVPGAQIFKKLHEVPQEICFFDYRDKDRARTQILHALLTTPCEDPEGLDAVVYFGHGWEHGLSSARFNDETARYGSAAQVAELAQAISMVSKHDVRVILHACRAGALADSFAKHISLALKSSDALVYAHELVPGSPHGDGHSFCNPYVTVWDKTHLGRFVIAPHSTYWNAWRQAMKAAKASRKAAEDNPLWACFPFMSQDQLEAYLARFSAGHPGHTGHHRPHRHGGHRRRHAAALP